MNKSFNLAQDKPKIILGIETSCDETSASVVKMSSYGKPSEDERVQILSNVVASSAELQSKYGGVIPEQAAREQLKSIISVIEEALLEAFEVGNAKWELDNLNSRIIDVKKSRSKTSHLAHLISKVDAIAVTQGPGLIGSLLVGVETAKVLATIWQKPLIPINHLLGHFYANWILQESRVESQESRKKGSCHQTLATSDFPKFPCLGLLVSGGHTDLVLFTDHGKYEYLGGTRDDAAGECFDKCARLLNLPYPGGPAIAAAAELARVKSQESRVKINLPRPMIDSGDLDFSFSGLKTAVLNLTRTAESEATENVILNGSEGSPADAGSYSNKLRDSSAEFTLSATNVPQNDSAKIANLAAAIEDAIIDVLVEKTARAVKTYNVDQIIVAGGVAANKTLARKLRQKFSEEPARVLVHIPPVTLCTDNAAYIATAAFFNYHPVDPLKLQANPNLSLVID